MGLLLGLVWWLCVLIWYLVEYSYSLTVFLIDLFCELNLILLLFWGLDFLEYWLFIRFLWLQWRLEEISLLTLGFRSMRVQIHISIIFYDVIFLAYYWRFNLNLFLLFLIVFLFLVIMFLLFLNNNIPTLLCWYLLDKFSYSGRLLFSSFNNFSLLSKFLLKLIFLQTVCSRRKYTVI